MAEMVFQPNWVSPPGSTIAALLNVKGITLTAFGNAIGLKESDASDLLQGSFPISPVLATKLSENVGSTARFWIERERQFQMSLQAMQKRLPALEEWHNTFPLRAMYEMGWLPKAKSKRQASSELLDFFGVSSITEWREKYLVRLGRTQFRTSEAFQNSIAATTAWIRRGELIALSMDCHQWDQNAFRDSLDGIKSLTAETDPKRFIPKLQEECARHGVAVVVTRCPPGCAASGATCIVDDNRALLLLSGRFLSDDQFWFSFFHEAGHLILHGDEPCVEEADISSPQRETEANAFAQSLILSPVEASALDKLPLNKFSISRFARRCRVSPGLIVGQLQHRNRISAASFNAFKVRYKASDFIL
jgi:HTH-type transcriptional regulator/antitoxin HigA